MFGAPHGQTTRAAHLETYSGHAIHRLLEQIILHRMRTLFDNGESVRRTNRSQCPEAFFIEAAVVVVVEVFKIRLEQYGLAEKGNAVGIRSLLEGPDNLLVVHVICFKKALALLTYFYCIHVVCYPSSGRSNVPHFEKHPEDGQANKKPTRQ